jgi:S-methylmethionine-dependent homocysteine/selenocysteine methylase
MQEQTTILKLTDWCTMADCSFLKEKLQAGRSILLDGATGTELEKRGVPMNSKAWTAEAVLSCPEVVQAVHRDYILAGAEVITVNSFSLAKHMLLPAGLAGQFRELNEIAVRLAVEARVQAATDPVAIAGSIAPTTFCLEPAKGYLQQAEALAGYAEQADILCQAGVDLLILEMIGDLEQSCLAMEAACGTGLPVWLGFSCRRTETGQLMLWDRGHTLSQGVGVISKIGGSAAFIMHTDVTDATEAFTELKKSWSGTLGVYAHSGVFVMPNWQFNDVISPEEYALEAGAWIKMGARIIGGCCGIGPAHIGELKKRYCF